MGPDERIPERRLAEIATLLGVADEAALSRVAVESLRRQTHRQLLEVSKRLGLSGVSKLNKDALAARLLQALAVRAQDDRRLVVEEAGHAVLSHKFEVGAHGAPPVEEPRTIPWGYGHDRLVAMPVDPESLYCYWEVTDDSIARTRARLGGGGPGAWLNLRVYDTTGRIFDGTNAHSYFDHKVERHDRQWFFSIGKAASEAFVEIGLRSHEGFFVRIIRSGRIEFPRREPVGWGDPEWMTVRVQTGEAESAGRGMPGRGSSERGPHFEPVPAGQARAPWEELVRFGEGGREERVEWEETWREGFFEGHRRFSWESPTMVSSWEAGPFTYPVEVPAPTRESYEGPLQVYKVAGRTHIVYGPWQVVIRGLGANYSRQVLARWEVHRAWVAEEGHEIQGLRVLGAGALGGASEQLAAGASERRWRGESELRLRGASERFYVGASEQMMRGASETLFAAASERRLRGASERRLQGESELRLRGASEQMMRGASELLYRGASEARLGGGSEDRLGGSEQRLHGGEPGLHREDDYTGNGEPSTGGQYPPVPPARSR